jgi:hypothetical protein
MSIEVASVRAVNHTEQIPPGDEAGVSKSVRKELLIALLLSAAFP